MPKRGGEVSLRRAAIMLYVKGDTHDHMVPPDPTLPKDVVIMTGRSEWEQKSNGEGHVGDKSTAAMPELGSHCLP